MPKTIPEEFKKSRFFKENAKEIKFTPNSYNEIYFTIEHDKDDETLVVYYPRNYSKPERIEISYDDLIEKYTTVEKLVNSFGNLIIFGVGGTLIKGKLTDDYDLCKCAPSEKLQNKIQELSNNPQLCFALSTRHRNYKNIKSFLKKLFPTEQTKQTDQAEKTSTENAEVFKGIQNNTDKIDIVRISDHFKKKFGYFMRNIIIINDETGDLPNPLDFPSDYVVIPDAKDEFLKEIDTFVLSTTIDMTSHLSSNSSSQEGFADYFSQQKERNKWLHYSLSPNTTIPFSPEALTTTPLEKVNKKTSSLDLMKKEWEQRTELLTDEGQKLGFNDQEPVPYQSLSQEWDTSENKM